MSLSDDTLYVASDLAVYAINPATGSQQWRFPGEGSDQEASLFFSEPTRTDDMVIVSSYNQIAYALGPDGNFIWSFDGEPVITETNVTATSADGEFIYLTTGRILHALDATSGREVWQFENENPLWAPPVLNDTLLFQPTMDHFLYALDPNTGALQWQQEFAGGLAGTPTLVEDTLYFGSLSNHAYAVDAATGRTRWDIETEGWVWSSPVVADGRAYFGDLDGVVYAVEAETGRIVWTTPLETGAIRGAPTITEDTLFVNTEDGFLHALNLEDGSSRWDIEVDPQNGDRLLATPVAADDLIVIAALNGGSLVYAYNQETGAPAWQFNPEN